MGLVISSATLESTGMTPEDFLIEVAVHMYDIGKMTMGQARNFANIDQITFQKEMAKRDVYIKYEMEDFMDDLEAIKSYENPKDQA